MIKFRQKNFGKISFRPKEWGPKLVKAIKENPLTAVNTVLSTAGIGIALKRSNNEKRFQKDQIKATEELTQAIEHSGSDELKENKKLVKKSQKPYTRDYYLPKPIEELQDKALKRIKQNKKERKRKSHDNI